MTRIIAAIDIIDGQCVRLSQGDYDRKKIYHSNPLEVAKSFEAAGIEYLHLVDLDGAKSDEPKNLKILESLASQTSLKIDFGGGVKSIDILRSVLNAGAVQVTLGSLAVKDMDLVHDMINEFGAEKIIIGADVKDDRIATHGWLQYADITLKEFIAQYRSWGAEYFVCTDIQKDGMLAGPAIDLYKNLMSSFEGIKLIASGGVATMEDIAALKAMRMDGIIIGKAIYEKTITMGQLVNIN